MKIGGLSEKEVDVISELLATENIAHEIQVDQEMLDANNQSMQYNLRHLSAPSISTDVLSIQISEKAFSEISKDLKEKLLDHGVTDEIPSELDFTSEHAGSIQSELLKGRKRVVGINFSHQLLIGGGALLIYYLIKTLLSYIK